MNHGVVMRALAEKYLRLARTSHNPSERSKFIDYAMLYAQLSEQARRRDGSSPTARRSASEAQDVPGRYAHGR